MSEKQKTFCQAAVGVGIDCKQGLQAVKKEYRAAIIPQNARDLTGSLDLDTAMKANEPQANRWDYGIGFKQGDDQMAIWIEPHPADTKEVDVIQKKLDWLKHWLTQNTDFKRLTDKTADCQLPQYVWLATKGIHINRPGANKLNRLRESGLKGPMKVLNLP